MQLEDRILSDSFVSFLCWYIYITNFVRWHANFSSCLAFWTMRMGWRRKMFSTKSHCFVNPEFERVASMLWILLTQCHICCLSWWPHRSATTECWPLCVLVQLSMLSCSDTVKILWKHASLKMSWSEKWQMPLHSIFFLWLTRITGSVFCFSALCYIFG